MRGFPCAVVVIPRRVIPEEKTVSYCCDCSFFYSSQSLLSNDSLANTPFLILGNKIDMPMAVSEGELRAALGLMETTGKDSRVDPGVRPIELFMCSIVRKRGYGDGFEWLSRHIKGTSS